MSGNDLELLYGDDVEFKEKSHGPKDMFPSSAFILLTFKGETRSCLMDRVTGWVDPVDTVSLKGGGTPLRFKRKAVGAARVF